jgi:hypothetical protein
MKRKREEEEEGEFFFEKTYPRPILCDSDIFHSLNHDELIDWLEKFRDLHDEKPDSELEHGYDKDLELSRFVHERRMIFLRKGIVYWRQLLLEKTFFDSTGTPLDSPIVIISTSKREIHKEELFAQTLTCMKLHIPIIYGGILWGEKEGLQVHCRCDFLVRSDCVSFLVKDFPKDIIPTHFDPQGESKNPEMKAKAFHYVVVAWRFVSLHLKGLSNEIASNSTLNYYSCLIRLQQEILDQIQGYSSGVAFLLGRKWSRQNERCESALDTMGVVLASNFIITRHMERIFTWLKELHLHGKEWKLHPPSVNYLRPNMKRHSSGWDKFKKSFATQLQDPSLIWRCSNAFRENLFRQGIYQWTDPRCTAEAMWFPKTPSVVNGKLINQMLAMQREGGKDTKLGVVFPSKLGTPDLYDWRRIGYELFLDIEFTSNLGDDLSQFPNIHDTSCNCMMGVGFFHPDKKQFEFRTPTLAVSVISKEEEIKVFKQFLDYVLMVKSVWASHEAKHLVKRNAEEQKIRVWTWSPAEESTLKKAYNSAFQRLSECQEVQTVLEQIEFCDLRKLVYANQVVIKDCWGYGVKQITRALLQHKLIDEKATWPESQIDNGLSAMIAFFRAHLHAVAQGTSIQQNHYYDTSEAYNRNDIYAMHCILDMFRSQF